MPSGACVIRYDGARGVTWKIKYVDAEGRQVKETVGREADGWTRQKAERALGAKLNAVTPRPPEAGAADVLGPDRRVRGGRAAGEAAEEVNARRLWMHDPAAPPPRSRASRP